MMFNPDNTGSGAVPIRDFDRAFMNGFTQEAQNPNSNLVQRFEDRDALVINATNPNEDVTQTELNKHPGAAFNDDPRDPTVRAVFLASFPRECNMF